MDRYPPVADHGLIGDQQTSALVSGHGVVDWFAAPRYLQSAGIPLERDGEDLRGSFALHAGEEAALTLTVCDAGGPAPAPITVAHVIDRLFADIEFWQKWVRGATSLNVDALARPGRLAAARYAFEKMQTYANHVGLFAEEVGPAGEQLGNFPQAFTHLALIMAAKTLDEALDAAGDGCSA
jgi:GH15 family glucan-1,4-alpha-glucosidase